MALASEEVHGLAVALSLAVDSLVPRIKEGIELVAVQATEILWPEGAPAVVSWTDVWFAQIAALDRSMDRIVALDLSKDARGAGASVIRRETAVRFGLTEQLKKQASQIEFDSLFDTMFASGPKPERFALSELSAASATLLLRLSRAVVEGDTRVPEVDLACTLSRLLVEYLTASMSILQLTHQTEHAAIVKRALDQALALRGQLLAVV